jgi:hypothetical protein
MASFDIQSKSTGKDYDYDYYKQLVKYNIFKEAYKRDSDANRLYSSNHNIHLTEIQKIYSAIGTLEEYKRAAREMEKKSDPLIHFVGDVKEDIIRITFNGRTYWETTQNRHISDLDL